MRKVSIITASYNSSRTIEDCLKSIVTQDYSNIEVLIIDGASKDKSLKIINEIQKSYKNIQVYSKSDHGIYDALNKGIRLAKGEIIGFVHSDDFLASSKVVSEIVQKMKDEEVDGVYGDLQYIDQKKPNKIVRYWKSCEFNFCLLKEGWMPPHPTLFLKKEVYQKYGNFNQNYKISADYDFMLRVFKDTTLRFFYLPKVIVKMRVGGASNKSLKNIIQKTKEDYKAITSNKIGNWVTLFLKNYSKFKQFF
jgi:glycosyltransferase involved in cell wall biosynthesis